MAMTLRAGVLALALAAGCAADVAGIYAGVLPSGEDGDRHVRLTLKPDGAAAISAAFSARPSRFLAEGRWERDGRRIVVTPQGGPGRMVFRRSGDYLVPEQWDRSTWGPVGPGELQRVR